LKEGLNKEKVGKDLTDTTLQIQHLKYNTSYSWQVVAKNSDDDVFERSEMWTFKTMPLPDLDIVYSALMKNNYEVFYADTAQNPTEYQITNYQTSSELHPKTSPSKEYLLYSSNKDLGFHLYLSKKDGSEERKILASEIGGYHYQGGRYCWAASDNYIYFASYNKLFKLNVNTGSKQQIAVAPADYHFGQLDWNENTHSIIVQIIGENINNSKIYIMDDDGENMAMVIDDLPGRIGRPSFSPDGSRFLYTYDVEGLENMEGRMLDSRMVIHTLSNHEEEDISAGNKPNGTNDLMVCFSRTGAKVVFVNTPNTLNAEKEIWIANADGSSRQKLIDNASMPSWY
jgi:TolB protein